jgi:hypothetical protein
MDQPNALRRTLIAGMALGNALKADAAETAPAPLNSPVTTLLRVEGRIKNPRTMAPEDLGTSIAAADIEDTPITGHDGATRRILRGYRGIKLIDLVASGDIASSDHNTIKRTYLVATASDGYVAVFSWGELYNATLGAGVWILFAKDGQLLGDEEGRFTLISTRDLRTGPRHVRWLSTISVNQV